MLSIAWLCAMIELTTLVSYQHFFTAGELFAWVTANPYEVGDIAGYCMRYVLPYWIICTVVFISACFLIWRCVNRGGRKQIWVCCAVQCLYLLPFTALPLRSNIVREATYVYRQIKNIAVHQNDSQSFSYQACKKDSLESAEIYVLAIGESVRYKNWSLNGIYERETTPMLAQQSNLCLYFDYYASATLTQHAIPLLFTPAIVDNFNDHFQYKSIAAAFSEAGFKSVLISHRAQLMNNGYHDYLAQDFDSVSPQIVSALAALLQLMWALSNYLVLRTTHYQNLAPSNHDTHYS